MKHILIPVVISTLIISQIIPINVSATTSEDTSTSEVSLGSGETIGEITVESVSSESDDEATDTDSSNNTDTSTSEISLGSGETIGEITVENAPEETNIGSNSTETNAVSQSTDNTVSNIINSSIAELTIMNSAPVEEITYTTEISAEREADLSNIINSSIAELTIMNSAPSQTEENNITYTPWEVIHNAFVASGFTWSGLIAHYIKPIIQNTHPITYIGSK